MVPPITIAAEIAMTSTSWKLKSRFSARVSWIAVRSAR